MGFGLNDVLKVAVPAYGATSLLGGMLGKKDKVSQEAMLTPEQKAMMAKLSGFAETGQFGDFKAGAEVPIQYMDARATGAEEQSLSALQNLLSTGIPEQYKLSSDMLKQYASADPFGGYQTFSDMTDREIAKASAGVKRSAGFAGNLYSTDTVKKLGDVEGQGVSAKAAELARLTDRGMDRKLSAAQLALQAGESEQGARIGQIDAAQRYGSVIRNLNNAAMAERNNELLRRRQELLLPIDAAKSVLGKGVEYGVPSVETSPYADLMNMVGQIGGTAIGAAIGGPPGAMIGGTIGKTVTGTVTQPRVTTAQRRMGQQEPR